MWLKSFEHFVWGWGWRIEGLNDGPPRMTFEEGLGLAEDERAEIFWVEADNLMADNSWDSARAQLRVVCVHAKAEAGNE